MAIVKFVLLVPLRAQVAEKHFHKLKYYQKFALSNINSYLVNKPNIVC